MTPAVGGVQRRPKRPAIESVGKPHVLYLVVAGRAQADVDGSGHGYGGEMNPCVGCCEHGPTEAARARDLVDNPPPGGVDRCQPHQTEAQRDRPGAGGRGRSGPTGWPRARHRDGDWVRWERGAERLRGGGTPAQQRHRGSQHRRGDGTGPTAADSPEVHARSTGPVARWFPAWLRGDDARSDGPACAIMNVREEILMRPRTVAMAAALDDGRARLRARAVVVSCAQRCPNG